MLLLCGLLRLLVVNRRGADVADAPAFRASLLFVKRRGADVADAPAFRAPESFICETEGV